MAEGEFTLVRKHLESAIPKLSQGHFSFGDHDVYTMLVDIAAQQQDGAALLRYAPLAEQAANQYGHRLYQAVVHRAWGVAHQLAGRHAEAEERLNLAMETFEELDTRWQIGRTYIELGRVAAAKSVSSVARDRLSKALAAFEAMNAAPAVARTRAMLEAIHS